MPDIRRPPGGGPSLQVNPSPEAINALGSGERPCGAGRFVLTWQKGERKGLPVTTYCIEPLCLDQDPPECTGPRFVPHMEQYDRNPRDPRRKRREVDMIEAVEASKVSARLAQHQTGRPEDRTDEQIANHIKAAASISTERRDEGASWTAANDVPLADRKTIRDLKR